MDHYQVLSMVPEVTAQQLSEATGPYPPSLDWEYTSLPDDLPQRVVDLATEVTAGAPSHYDRALAVEEFLRTIPYDLRVAKPPEARDVVAYFLFELQRGYCDYFASTMVVMARAVGIPARLAVGYAMGCYDAAQGAYVVTAMDAHAWPELYFPGYGWIPFEPTPAFSLLERAQATEEQGRGALPLLALPQRSWWVRLQVEARLLWLRWRAWTLAVVVGLAVAWAGRRLWLWWLPGLSPEHRVAWSYARLREMAPRLGVAVHPWDTPAEFSLAMQRGLVNRTSRWARLRSIVQRDVKQAVAGVSLLTQAYERVSYAPGPPDSSLMQQARMEGQRLHWRLWKLRTLSWSP